MNKTEFIRKLKIELSRLPGEEIDEAVQYYTEYIEDAGSENEEQTIRELGSPAKIATQIKADYAVKQLDPGNAGRKDGKRGAPVVLWVILGIFAAPIALPLAIAGGVVALAMIIVCAAIAISLLVCVVAVFATGIVSVIAGFTILFVDFPGAIFAIGVGLAVTGAMLLAGAGVILATRAAVRAIARGASQRSQRRAAEKGDKSNEQ